MSNYVKMVVFLFAISALCAAGLTTLDLQTREKIEENRQRDRLVHILKAMRVLPENVQELLQAASGMVSRGDSPKDRFQQEAFRIEWTELYLKKQETPSLVQLFSSIRVLEIPADLQKMKVYKGKEFLQNAKADYLHKIYVFKIEKESGSSYCFEISGAGFWDKISGYLVLEEGLSNIGGISFFDHKETPGLGQRIEEGWFQAQFTCWKKRVFAEDSSVEPQVRVTPLTGNYLGDCASKQPNEVDAITGASETSRAMDRLLTENLRVMFAKLSKAVKVKEAREFFDEKTLAFLKKMES